MRKNIIVWLILLAILAIFCSAGTASAMSAFSRKYKMQCDGCHTSKLPQLNEFGIEFYKNGFELTKQNDTARGGAGQGGTTPDAGRGRPAGKTEAKAPAKGDQNDSGDDDKEGEPPKKEIPPTVVYRSKSPDGTAFFTDTPERRTDFSWQQDDGPQEPEAGAAIKIRQPKKKRTAGCKLQVQQPIGQPGGGKSVESERFRSYEECMERQLVGAKQPGSAQEMMDMMMAAERNCSGYARQTREVAR